MQNHRISCILDSSRSWSDHGGCLWKTLLQETPGPPWRESGFIFLSGPTKELTGTSKLPSFCWGTEPLGLSWAVTLTPVNLKAERNFQVLISIYRKYLKYETTLHCINFFFFFLAEERSHSQPLIISLGLILLLLIIGFALAIPFFVIPLYKASELFECLFNFLKVIYVVNIFYCINSCYQ